MNFHVDFHGSSFVLGVLCAYAFAKGGFWPAVATFLGTLALYFLTSPLSVLGWTWTWRLPGS
jgi:hypothetical protein